MKKFSTILYITFFFLSIFITGCGGGGSSSSGGGYTPAPVSNPKWTIMIYMDADNNLDSYAVKDLDELQEIGSTSQVNVIVEVDRASRDVENFTTTKIFYVQQNNLKELEDLGEKDMSDPQTLQDFINYCYSNYKADNYALILWDHGAGYKALKNTIKRIKNKDIKTIKKGMFVDDTTSNSNIMSLSEIHQAISNSNLTKVNILAFDACLMGMTEVAYNFKDVTDYIVFSEASVPADGFPYNTILRDITQNPNLTAQEFSSKIVLNYKNYYDSQTNEYTLSAIDTSKIDTLITYINEFADALKNSQTPQAIIGYCAFNTDYYSEYYSDYIDLGHFAYLISTNQDINDVTLKEKATQLYDYITNSGLVVSMYNGQTFKNSTGLSIYLPSPYWYKVNNQSQWNDIYSTDYNNITLTQNYDNWKNFLTNHINNFSPYIKSATLDLNTNIITITGFGFGSRAENQYYDSKLIFDNDPANKTVNDENCNSWNLQEIKANNNSYNNVYVETAGRDSNNVNITN